MKSNILMALNKQLGGRVKSDFILAPFTTFKMGGPAEFYFAAQTDEDIVNAVKTAKELNLALTILGGASNVVVSDKGIKGLVIRNQVLYKKIVEQNEEFVLLQVSSGYSITRLAKETAEEGLSGFEYHLGLPGTLGGALYMNSKWTRPEVYIGDYLVEAELVDLTGNVKRVARDYFQFAYDTSILQKTKEIVLRATFKLTKNDPVELIRRGKEALEYRKQTQPYGVASSGCFFRNVDGESAGKMIDRLGLKGFRVGGAMISDTHANFIINTGEGTSTDVDKLIKIVKDKVREKFGVELQEEIIQI